MNGLKICVFAKLGCISLPYLTEQANGNSIFTLAWAAADLTPLVVPPKTLEHSAVSLCFG